MRKNKKETGIKQLEDKSYFVRVTRRINGERVERRGKAATKAEAKKLLSTFTLELEDIKESAILKSEDKNNLLESNSITFEIANDLWLSSLDPGLAIGTKKTYYYNYKTIIRVIDKDTLIENIDLKHIEKLKKSMVIDKSISHINTCVKQVFRVLDYCRKLGYIEKNGVADFSIYKITKNTDLENEEKHELNEMDEEQLGPVYSKEEIEGMLVVLKDTLYETPFRIGYGMGMRIAEILGLTWNNVNLKNGTIDVKRQQQYYSKVGYVMTYVKSKKSKRLSLYMPTDLWEYMKKLYEEHKEKGFIDVENKMQNEKGKHLTLKGFVCCDEAGNHLKQSAPTVMQNILEKAGYKGFNSHSLRKTHTTELARSGMPLHAVSERLGHNDITTTLNFYTYNTEEDNTILNNYIRGKGQIKGGDG